MFALEAAVNAETLASFESSTAYATDIGNDEKTNINDKSIGIIFRLILNLSIII